MLSKLIIFVSILHLSKSAPYYGISGANHEAFRDWLDGEVPGPNCHKEILDFLCYSKQEEAEIHQYLKEGFDLVDTNKDGKITKLEFQNIDPNARKPDHPHFWDSEKKWSFTEDAMKRAFSLLYISFHDKWVFAQKKEHFKSFGLKELERAYYQGLRKLQEGLLCFDSMGNNLCDY